MSELREALKEVTQSSLSGKFAHSAILLSGRGQSGTTTGVSHTVPFELPVCALILNRLLMNAESMGENMQRWQTAKLFSLQGLT